jgi:hypothetical protein
MGKVAQVPEEKGEQVEVIQEEMSKEERNGDEI